MAKEWKAVVSFVSNQHQFGSICWILTRVLHHFKNLLIGFLHFTVKCLFRYLYSVKQVMLYTHKALIMPIPALFYLHYLCIGSGAVLLHTKLKFFTIS